MPEFAYSTAVLYFSLSPRREFHRKRLSNSVTRNRLLLISLDDHIKSKLGNVEMDVILWDENKQVGNSFGERFAHAFQTLFDRGYENIIAVGNDCPELSIRDITDAASILARKLPVLGPARDGGVYLLGLTKIQFNPVAFENISWNTAKVELELAHLFPDRQILEKKTDIDSVSDIQWITKNSLLLKFIKWLISVVRQVDSIQNQIVVLFEKQFVLRHGLLPPPSA